MNESAAKWEVNVSMMPSGVEHPWPTAYSARIKLNVFSDAVEHLIQSGQAWIARTLPTQCPVCAQQRRCRQPETLGSAGSLTHASSARILSIEEEVRGITDRMMRGVQSGISNHASRCAHSVVCESQLKIVWQHLPCY